MLVALVKVRHCRYKPSIHSLVHIHLGCIWVEHWCELIACLQILVVGHLVAIHCLCLNGILLILGIKPFGGVKPILRRHILNPRMLKATMVENHIHHYLQSLLVSLINKFTIIGI